MKKFFISILVVLLPFLAMGQMQIGIKGGYIYYWFTDPEDGQYYTQYDYSHSAFSIAAIIRQRSLHTFNYGFEIEYTNRSFDVESSWGGLGAGTDADLSYTLGNIFIHFQPQFTFGSKFKFFIYPGIYFGTLLHSSLQGTIHSWQMGNPVVSETDTINGSAGEYYPNFEFGISPGIGIEFPVYNNLNLVFEYKFTMNLLPIASSWGSEKVKMLNMNFEVGLAYTLGKKKSNIEAGHRSKEQSGDTSEYLYH